MSLPRFVLVCSLPLLAAMPACEGKSTTPAPATKVEASSPKAPASTPVAAPVETPSPVADGGPSAAEIAAVEASRMPPTQGPVPSLQDDPEKALGAHLADPRWFRKSIFGNEAKVLDTKRSQADDQGRFSSLIRFEVPELKPEGCADHLQGLVKDDIPNLERKVEPDGRVQLSGNNERYKITFICGEAEGKTIAYVSYQWT